MIPGLLLHFQLLQTTRRRDLHGYGRHALICVIHDVWYLVSFVRTVVRHAWRKNWARWEQQLCVIGHPLENVFDGFPVWIHPKPGLHILGYPAVWRYNTIQYIIYNTIHTIPYNTIQYNTYDKIKHDIYNTIDTMNQYKSRESIPWARLSSSYQEKLQIWVKITRLIFHDVRMSGMQEDQPRKTPRNIPKGTKHVIIYLRPGNSLLLTRGSLRKSCNRPSGALYHCLGQYADVRGGGASDTLYVYYNIIVILYAWYIYNDITILCLMLFETV